VVTPCLLYLPVHLRAWRRRAAAPPVAGTPLPEAAD